jgi:DNA invertase Pin-like site-specific DNA recombinase
VGYVRVSSADQRPDRQYEAIGDVDRLFEDRLSGKDTERPQLIEMLRYVRTGDEVRVADMSRLARSLPDLRALVDQIVAKGSSVTFLKENVTFSPDKSDAIATLLLSVLGAIAEFERALIRERQAEGIALAKARGVYKGGQRKIKPEQLEFARERVALGVPKAVVARELGVARQTLYDALAGKGVYAA